MAHFLGALTFTSNAMGNAYVEILESTGAMDGPPVAVMVTPEWEQVRLDLKVKNHLTVPIHELKFAVSMLLRKSGQPQNIPGWKFAIDVEETVPPRSSRYVRIIQQLPPRRTPLSTKQVVYQANLDSYRMQRPVLALAVELLHSPHIADQNAALISYELAHDAEIFEVVRDELRQILRQPEPHTEAAPLLLAVYALGSLQATDDVPILLELPEKLPTKQWTQAVRKLALRWAKDQMPHAPRKALLPLWARGQTAFLALEDDDTLHEIVCAALMRMGDSAVPALVAASLNNSNTATQLRAKTVLNGLARGTPARQLALADPKALLKTIQIYQKNHDARAVPKLVCLLESPDQDLAKAARQALISMRPALFDYARQHNLVLPFNESAEEIITRLRQKQKDDEKNQRHIRVLTAEKALKAGRYQDALQILSQIKHAQIQAYREQTSTLVPMFITLAEERLAYGDFHTARQLARTSRELVKSATATQILDQAHLALADGYLELGELDEAATFLGLVHNTKEKRYQKSIQALDLARIEQYLDYGELAKAQQLYRSRFSLNPSKAAVRLKRQILLRENWIVILLLSLIIPVSILIAVLFWKRRRERTDIEDFAENI